jgi:hypothetical protein
MSSSDVRAAVLARFHVDDKGRITDPGKYEGEQLYVPYFHRLALDGAGDGEDVVTIKVEALDRVAFPELGKVKEVVLWLNREGLVQELHPEREGRVHV